MKCPFEIGERVFVKRHEGGYEEGTIEKCYTTYSIYHGKNSATCDILWGDNMRENLPWSQILNIDKFSRVDNCCCRNGGKTKKSRKHRKSRSNNQGKKI